MSLYEISNDFQTLYDALDDIDLNEENGENLLTAYFDTLEGIEGEFEHKAENIAVFIKELIYEAENLDKEKKNLDDRSKQKKQKAESLKRYLMNCMEQIGRYKIDTPKAVISLRNNAESVQIDEPDEFIAWAKANRKDLLNYKEPEIKKALLKKEMQNGLYVSGVSLIRSKSLIVK